MSYTITDIAREHGVPKLLISTKVSILEPLVTSKTKFNHGGVLQLSYPPLNFSPT